MPTPRRCSHLVLATAFSALCPPLAAQTLEWSGQLGLASDWVVRGLQLSEGRSPVLFAGLGAYTTTGWSWGAAAMQLRDGRGRRSPVWSLRAGHEWLLDERWRLLTDLSYHGYERSPSLAGWSVAALALGLSYRDFWSLTWHAEQARDPKLDLHSLDFNLRWPLGPQLAVNGGLGHVSYALGRRYSYGQLGLETGRDGWLLRLERSWTAAAAARSFGSLAAGRWLASIHWTF